jgi:RES domain-containing protein
VIQRLWRIAADTPDYTADELGGDGARKTGGRWNSAGNATVYSATSIALAALETVVHLDGPPFNRYLVEILVPDGVWRAAVRFDGSKHVGWDAIPAGRVSIAAGDAWLLEASSAILFVPSTVVPEEFNALINPMHPDAPSIQARKVRRFVYDPRLLTPGA